MFPRFLGYAHTTVLYHKQFGFVQYESGFFDIFLLFSHCQIRICPPKVPWAKSPIPVDGCEKYRYNKTENQNTHPGSPEQEVPP